MDDEVFQKYEGLIAPVPIKHFKFNGGVVEEDSSRNLLSANELTAARATIHDVRTVESALYAREIEQEKIPRAESPKELVRALSCGLKSAMYSCV